MPGRMLGRLASVVAKELLNGQHVVSTVPVASIRMLSCFMTSHIMQIQLFK